MCITSGWTRHRWRSVSRTSRISEVSDAGEARREGSAAGHGAGLPLEAEFLLAFQERDGGTWIECEAISLTRDVPTGLGWAIQPVIKTLPRDSLQNTLRATRAALVGR